MKQEELNQFRIEANIRFVLLRWLYVLLGIVFVGIYSYVSGNDPLSMFSLVGQLMIVFFGVAVFNFLLLFLAQYIESKNSAGLSRAFSIFQVSLDLAVMTLIVNILSIAGVLWPVPMLYFIPLAEAIVLFDAGGALLAALIAGILLVISKSETFLIKDFSLYESEIVYALSFVSVTLVLAYHHEVVVPSNLFKKKEEKKIEKLEEAEKMGWVRKYGKKMEASSRQLYAKELELKLATEELEQLDKAKSKFVSVTAHQMRTPLSAIKWTFNMMLSEQLGEINKEQRKFLEQGAVSADRMIMIVNNLLQIDKVDAKTAETKMDEVQLVPLIDNVVSEFLNQIKSKNIDLKLHWPKVDLPTIHADPGKIRIVMENLLDNAIKYTPKDGQINIDVKDEKVNSANPSIEVAISDSGIGIPKDEQRKVFSQFFRASNAVSTEPDGSGVGLYICKDIIESHGGVLWFESTPGKGSTFRFSLPISQKS